jgi:hypothetical protein
MVRRKDLGSGPPGQAGTEDTLSLGSAWPGTSGHSLGPLCCNPTWPLTPVSLAVAGFLGCDLDNVFSF